MSKSLTFWANCSFAHFFGKKRAIRNSMSEFPTLHFVHRLWRICGGVCLYFGLESAGTWQQSGKCVSIPSLNTSLLPGNGFTAAFRKSTWNRCRGMHILWVTINFSKISKKVVVLLTIKIVLFNMLEIVVILVLIVMLMKAVGVSTIFDAHALLLCQIVVEPQLKNVMS